MAVALYLILLALLVVGLGITIMTLPGLWLMLAATAGYAWGTHWRFIGWKTLLLVAVITIVAEIIETTSASSGARRAGAGRRGAWGALIGGIIGGIFLTIPLFLIGTLIGVCIGTFVGAMIAELTAGQEVGRSAIIGASAAGGRLKGTILKLGFGCVIFAVVFVVGFPLGRGAPAASPTTRTALQPSISPLFEPVFSSPAHQAVVSL